MPKCRVSTRNLISLFFFSCKEKHWNPICSFSERGIFCLFPFFLNAFGLLKYFYNIYPPCHCNNEDGQTTFTVRKWRDEYFLKSFFRLQPYIWWGFSQWTSFVPESPRGQRVQHIKVFSLFSFLVHPKTVFLPPNNSRTGLRSTVSPTYAFCLVLLQWLGGNCYISAICFSHSGED